MDTRHIMARTRRREVLNIKRLRKRYASILDEIEPRQITPYMFERDAIELEEMTEINRKKRRKKRAESLLKMIFERGDKPFDEMFVYGAFLSSLKLCGYNTLVDTIKNTDVDADFDLGLGEHKIITGNVLRNKALESKRGVMFRFLEFGHKRYGVIEATAFDSEAMELAESLIVGNTYTIRDVFVKKIPEDYMSTDSIGVDFEVVLTKSSYIISNETLSEDNYEHEIDYATIAEIKQSTAGSIVNLVAGVKALESPFCTPAQGLICQEIYLSDSSGEQLKMAVFEQNVNKFKVGDEIQIYRATVETFNGEVKLKTSLKTDISVLNSPVTEDVPIPVIETDSDDVVRCQAVICRVRNYCRRRHGYGDWLEELPNGKYICTKCKELCQSHPNGFSIVLKLRESSSGETFKVVGFNKLGKKLFNTNYEAFTMYEPLKQQLLLKSVVGDEYIFSYKKKLEQREVIDIAQIERPSEDQPMVYDSNKIKKERISKKRKLNNAHSDKACHSSAKQSRTDSNV